MTELTRKFKRPISPLKVLKPNTTTNISHNLILNRAVDKQWKGSKMELDELQNIRDNYITQQNMESRFQQSSDETVILQTLKCKIEEILQHDAEDPLFGRTEDDPNPIIQQTSDIIVQDLTVDKEIQQNVQFLISNDKLDTCNDVEMMNVAFDGILQQLNQLQLQHPFPQMPSIIDTLNQLKVYYINKIFHKSALEKAAAEATKVLDNKCQHLISESDIMQQQLTQITKRNEQLTKENADLKEKLKQQVEVYQNTHQQAINYQKMVRDYLEKLERLQTAYDKTSVIVEQFKHRSKMATDSMLKAKMHLKHVMQDKMEIQQLNENLKIEKLNFKVQIDALQKQVNEEQSINEGLQQMIDQLNAKITELTTKDPDDIRNKTMGEVFSGTQSGGSYIKQAISALIKLSSAEFQDQLTQLLNVTKEELGTHRLVMEKIYYANNIDELLGIANLNQNSKRGRLVHVEVQVDDVAYKHLMKEYNKISLSLADSQRAYEEVRRQLQSMASSPENLQIQSARSQNAFQLRPNISMFSLSGMYYTSNINVLSQIFGNINTKLDTTFLKDNAKENEHINEAIDAYNELESELVDMPQEIRRDMRLAAASSLFNKHMPRLIKTTLNAPMPIDKKLKMKRLAKELEITRQKEEDKRALDQISSIINEIIERSKREKTKEAVKVKFIEQEKTTHMVIDRDVKRADPSDNYLEFVASGESSLKHSRNNKRASESSSPITKQSENDIENSEQIDNYKNEAEKNNTNSPKSGKKPPSGRKKIITGRKSPLQKSSVSTDDQQSKQQDNNVVEQRPKLSRKEQKRQENIQKLVELIQNKMDASTVKRFVKQLENKSGDWDVIFSDSISITTEELADPGIEDSNSSDNEVIDGTQKQKNKGQNQSKNNKLISQSNKNEIDVYDNNDNGDIVKPLYKRNTMRLCKSGLLGNSNSQKVYDQNIYQLTAISYVERQTDQQLLEEELNKVQNLLERDNEEYGVLDMDGVERQYCNRGMITDMAMGFIEVGIQTDETNDGIDQAAVTAEILKIFQDDADGQNIEDFDPRQFGEDGETDFKMQFRQNVNIRNVLEKEAMHAQNRHQNRNLRIVTFDKQHQNNVMLQQLMEKFKNQQKSGKDVPISPVLQEGMPSQLLIKNQNVFKLKKVVTEVKPNFINYHPRFGNVAKIEYGFQIPQLQQFALVHFKDNLILKYYPDNFDNISCFCPCVVKTFNIKVYKELHNNTKQQFQSLYNDPNYKQSMDQSLLPFIEQKIQLIRLSSLILTGKPNTQPLLFKLVARTFGYQIKFVQFNNQQYIQIPFHNITLRSLNWTIRLVRSIINSRVEQNCSFIKLLMENQSDLNVIQTFNYEIFQNTLEKQHYDNLAGFTVNWIRTKYGQPNICLQLVYSLLANISFYQYENSEIYLFTRMLMGDVDDDYFLLYCDMRRSLGLYNLECEYVHVDVINQLVYQMFQNWPITRLKVFCEQIYALLYAKVSGNQQLGCVIGFVELAQLMLYSYGVYRTQVYKEFLTVYRYMVREQQMNGLKLESEGLTEGSFKQFFNALLPAWPDSSIYEFFYYHKSTIKKETGNNFTQSQKSDKDDLKSLTISENSNTNEAKTNNEAQQHKDHFFTDNKHALVVTFHDIQNIFVSTQLGRFVDVSTTLLNQLIDLECKKMTKRLSFMFQQTQPIISQVTMYLTMQKNRQTLQLGAAAKTKIEQQFMSVMEKIKTINKQIQQDIIVYDVVNGILNFGKLINIFLSELVDMRQNLCLVVIGGALNSLGQFLRVIDADGAKQVAEMQAEAKKASPLTAEDLKLADVNQEQAPQQEQKPEEVKNNDAQAQSGQN